MAEKVHGYAKDRTQLIDDLISELEISVTKAQEKVYRQMIDKFIDKLDVKDGKIQNTRKNIRLLTTVDAVFNNFQASEGITMLNTVIESVNTIINFNNTYFSNLGGEAFNIKKIEPEVRAKMNEWLGIEKGAVKQNGYLDKIIKDTSIRNQVKNLAVKNIITQSGFFETKKQLSELINGIDKTKQGALQKYYRNFVYDTYSISDRIVGLEYANSMGYEFAIYEGGSIETSRLFCRERNGKVFHKSEIEKFSPPTAKPPNYNPFIDLGGYGCRHHLNWISTKLAKFLGKKVEMFISLQNRKTA